MAGATCRLTARRSRPRRSPLWSTSSVHVADLESGRKRVVVDRRRCTLSSPALRAVDLVQEHRLALDVPDLGDILLGVIELVDIDAFDALLRDADWGAGVAAVLQRD